MALSLKFILQAVDRASAPTKQFVGALVGLRTTARTAPAPVRAVAAASNEQAASADRAREPTRGLAGDIARLAGSITRAAGLSGVGDKVRASATAAARPVVALVNQLGKLPPALRKVWAAPGVGDRITASANRAGEAVGRLTTKIARMTGVAAGAAAVSFAAFGGSVIKTGADFESFGITLETTLGSARKAQDGLRWVQKFAETTPYELNQVLEGFVRLNAYGIDATDGSLRSLGNGASAMNKDLMAAVEMLADAQTGEFERLKEFGIRASQEGNKVRLTYSKAGKDITVTTTKSSAAIRKAILGIFDARFDGAMDRQSKSLKGLFANLKDMVTKFQLDIANAGVFDFVKKELASLLAAVNQASADGSLQRWAGQISASLIELFQALKGAATAIDWPGLISGIAGFISKTTDFLKAIGGMGTVLDVVVIGSIIRMSAAILGLAVPALGALGVAAWPITLTVGIIAALAAGAYLLIRNWGGISAWFAGLWKGILNGCKALWEGAKSLFVAGAKMLYDILPPWMKLLITGGRFVFNAVADVVGGAPGHAPRPPSVPPGAPRPPASPPIAARPNAAARPTAAPRPTAQVRPTANIGANAKAQNNRLKVDLAVDSAGQARIRSVRTSTPDVSVQMARGPVTAGV